MSNYAIYDITRIVNRMSGSIDENLLEMRYVCALFAELAYYHIPQWEIDNQKRAKLIPCERYQDIVTGGYAVNIVNVLQGLDLPRAFVVVERGVVATGMMVGELLFIGFRGTQFLYDWQVNLRARLTMRPADGHQFRFHPPGRFHVGFTEEALRISIRITDAIKKMKIPPFTKVILSGHSLGGAIASIAQYYIDMQSILICILGAPRYGDVSSYSPLSGVLPTQIRRLGDIVPTTPPRLLGYADHPYEFSTNGHPYVDSQSYWSASSGLLRWLQFLTHKFEPHSIEKYRRELGAAAGEISSDALLIPWEKLSKRDLS